MTTLVLCYCVFRFLPRRVALRSVLTNIRVMDVYTVFPSSVCVVYPNSNRNKTERIETTKKLHQYVLRV